MENKKTIIQPPVENDTVEEMANEDNALEERRHCIKCGAVLDDVFEGNICDECMLRRKNVRRVIGGIGFALTCTAVIYFGGRYIKANPQKIDKITSTIKKAPKEKIIQAAGNIKNNVEETVVTKPINWMTDTGKHKLKKTRECLSKWFKCGTIKSLRGDLNDLRKSQRQKKKR